ncbi:hypothetical protein TRVL_06560 [Trypanosoma vivax]|nr:hypothetical protein TRVL_06560 [Trypanosoma vivax]
MYENSSTGWLEARCDNKRKVNAKTKDDGGSDGLSEPVGLLFLVKWHQSKTLLLLLPVVIACNNLVYLRLNSHTNCSFASGTFWNIFFGGLFFSFSLPCRAERRRNRLVINRKVQLKG